MNALTYLQVWGGGLTGTIPTPSSGFLNVIQLMYACFLPQTRSCGLTCAPSLPRSILNENQLSGPVPNVFSAAPGLNILCVAARRVLAVESMSNVPPGFRAFSELMDNRFTGPAPDIGNVQR